MGALYQLTGAGRDYRTGDGIVHALRNVTITIDSGEVVSIGGSSGSGKSTLLLVLGALETATAGEITIDGRPMSGMSDRALTAIRSRTIGYVFQQFNLIATLSALDNVELAMLPSGMDRRARSRRATELLERVGLAHRVHHLPSRLSGGEQQRVAIARALANGPRVLIADEPTGNLDAATANEIMQLLVGLQRDDGTTIVIATHDPAVAAHAHRHLSLRDGLITEDTTERATLAARPAATVSVRTSTDSGDHQFSLRGVGRTFAAGRGPVVALTEVDLDIDAGEVVALEGPSGSGKSTLLTLLGALETPSQGTLRFDGVELTTASDAALTRIRRTALGFIFQQFNLIPTLSAAENVAAAMLPTGALAVERRERANQLLADVGLAHRRSHLPSRLSGGEQQRVAIARALANRPRVIIADEPTGNLDGATADEIMALLLTLQRDHSITVILATHDPDVAAHAHRRLRLDSGRVVSDSPA